MIGYPAISLNSVEWRYLLAQHANTDYSAVTLDDSQWIPLARLSDWVVASSAQPGADWFRCAVRLEATERCVSYQLKLDTVPESVEIYVNGQHVGSAAARRGFCADVTPLVRLGSNIIAMRLTCSGGDGGTFGSVSLQPVPCDEETLGF